MAETDVTLAATMECAGQPADGQRRLLRGKVESVEALAAAVRSAYGFGPGASFTFVVKIKPEQSKLA